MCPPKTWVKDVAKVSSNMSEIQVKRLTKVLPNMPLGARESKLEGSSIAKKIC